MIGPRATSVAVVVMMLFFGWNALSSPSDLAAYQNGDILIGTRMSGEGLSREAFGRSLLVVINTPYQVFDQAGTFIHVAAWTTDGTPARGAMVYLSGHLLGRMDENGSFAFRWGVPASGVADYWLNGSDIDVRWNHQGETYGGGVRFSALSRTQSFASDHLFVYTDRGVYNPGQVLHTRALGWHLAADWGPISGRDIELLLNDPDGQSVAGAALSLNEFGVGAVDFPLSQHAREGMYELVATYEGARATTRLRVERFVPPLIDINHTLGRFLTRDQTELSWEVRLGYFTPGEFHSGRVSVQIEVDGQSRYSYEQDVSGPGPHPFSVSGQDLDGIRRGLRENQRVEVLLSVQDLQRRQSELRRELRFTANPYIAVIEKDRDAYSTGDPIELVVRLTDRERVPVREREVTLRTSRGEELRARSDQHGTVQFRLQMQASTFTVEVFLSDVTTALVASSVPWQSVQPMRSHVAEAIVRENEPARVSVRFPSTFEPAESMVHMDVVDSSGSLVNSVLLPVRREGGQWLAEGSFSAPSWGSMLLTFFCLGRDTRQAAPAGGDGHSSASLGLLTEGQNLVVHPGRELTITLEGELAEVAPGSAWSARVLVTDRRGNPVDAAVGVAVVDQSVISLKDPLEITPMDHFYNPELRVISTTGAAILTWPVVSRNWGQRTHDIALPPFPYLEGGSVERVVRRRNGGAIPSVMSGAMPAGAVFEMAESADSAFDSIEVEFELAESADSAFDSIEVEGALMSSPEAAAAMFGSRGEAAPAPVEAPVIITMRTEFPETSLWEPLLTASAGVVEVEGSMPDSITTQQISVVASSSSGGVGVLRHPVSVTQPLFVESNLPNSLTVGDTIEAGVVVQNLSDQEQRVSLRFESDLLAVGLAEHESLTIAPGSVGVVRFPVVARRAGLAEYTLSAVTAQRVDSERRAIWVRPSGVPEVMTLSLAHVGEGNYETTIDVPEGGQLTTVTLNVAFPAAGSAFAGLDAIVKNVAGQGVMGVGGELIAAAHIYQLQQQRGMPQAELDDLRLMLQRGLADLLAAQQQDGGWGFFWHQKSSPYVTAYCLEALLTLERLDFVVPVSALQRAVNLLATRVEGQLIDVQEIAFWEGNSEAVRLGLTAEIFSVLAQVTAQARTSSWTRVMAELGSRFESYLDHESPEVMAYAHAVLGLHRLSTAGLRALPAERLLNAARRLNDLRVDGHWEPSWFNAYGGTIEATVTVLEVYRALGASQLAGDERGLIRYLLSTRDEWGGWHNPRGTASAIRGILMLCSLEPEVASRVVVSIDGEVIREVEIDPADPFLSAIELRSLDISEYLSAGNRNLSIRYDGNLEPDMRLSLRHWPESQDQLVAEGISLRAELSESAVTVGSWVEYTFEIASTRSESQLLYLDVSRPGNARWVESSIQELLEAESIQWWESMPTGLRLWVLLDAGESRSLSLQLEAERAGVSSMPMLEATLVRGPDASQWSKAISHPVGMFSVR